ncbi:hypothetical protein [Bradyrhizobium sp. 199]|uniref:hypothetical protein n=1 Tax=Bradyrhizobium sp. 199 TaxID=2782664 RepID=UPI001FF87B9C|nr:hypothetical protein [Bradyrhizobium sp. 199]MCK1359851.1 hypothetical protein [Bradyrhizobium sp. 199]
MIEDAKVAATRLAAVAEGMLKSVSKSEQDTGVEFRLIQGRLTWTAALAIPQGAASKLPAHAMIRSSGTHIVDSLQFKRLLLRAGLLGIFDPGLQFLPEEITQTFLHLHNLLNNNLDISSHDLLTAHNGKLMLQVVTQVDRICVCMSVPESMDKSISFPVDDLKSLESVIKSARASHFGTSSPTVRG